MIAMLLVPCGVARAKIVSLFLYAPVLNLFSPLSVSSRPVPENKVIARSSETLAATYGPRDR
ncbi:hypothetical protein RIEGSTA812A_PEG_1099 [invertebrate metagenome]|uniref:Uncharacterized protein n=1 Tax=invertebrate metagenome TaxID=1711999 RepID=A0A484H683_9ZZZZ